MTLDHSTADGEADTDSESSADVEEIVRKPAMHGRSSGFQMVMEGIVHQFIGPGSGIGGTKAETQESVGGLDTEAFTALQAFFGSTEKGFAKEKKKWTPLHCAASEGSVAIVKTLLAHKAKVDSREDDQWTPLHLAAQNGHLEVVKALLEHGADKDALADGHITPLFQAAGNGKLEVVKVLLAHGADPNSETEYKRTPLFMAALEDANVEVIKVLIDAGADINHVSKNDLTPLHIAATLGFTANVKALLAAKALVNVRDYELWTPLHFAAYSQRDSALEIVRVLIDAGADLSARTNNGRTALHLAASNSDGAEIVEYLIECGANKEAQDHNERTPIFSAVGKGSLEVLNILANAGANVEVVDDDQINLLHLACARGDIEIVEKLIKLGVDVNAVTPKGWQTPLMVAVRQGSIEMVNILLESGADPC